MNSLADILARTHGHGSGRKLVRADPGSKAIYDTGADAPYQSTMKLSLVLLSAPVIGGSLTEVPPFRTFPNGAFSISYSIYDSLPSSEPRF